MASPRANVFDRWTPVWHVFFYVMIAVATVLAFQNFAEKGHGPRGLVLGLDAVLVAWHWMLIVRLGRVHRERPRRVAIYLAGATLVSVTLVHFDPVFLMVAMTLYNHVFAFMVMRWAIPAAVVLTSAIGAVMLRTANATGVLVLMLGSGCALMFALFLTATSNESEKRQALIDELERTREQLAFAERLAGRTEERHRIGRELHDTVTQQLVGIVMQLEAASTRDGDARAAVESALRLAREGLAEARRLVWAERPAQLENGSLSRALEQITERFAKESGLRIDRTVSEEVDELPAAVQTLVLRGVQEALANVRRHAKAQCVALSVSLSSNLLAVDVNDDGIGFDGRIREAPDARRSGFGLRGLRERVEAAGGSLSIESAHGRGTTIAFHLPVVTLLERHEERG